MSDMTSDPKPVILAPKKTKKTTTKKATPKQNYTVQASRKGLNKIVEIVFNDDARPTVEQRNILKENAFKWTAFNRCWYGPAMLLLDTEFGPAVQKYLKS